MSIFNYAGDPMPKQRNIKNILILSHAVVSVSIATILLVWIAVSQIHSIKEASISDMYRLSSSIVYGVSSEIEKMNTVSLSILYSNLIKNSFETYLKSTDNNPTEQYKNLKNLGDLLSSINIQNISVSEITLYDLEQGAYTFGVQSGFVDLNVKDQSWYLQALKNKGVKYITLPYTDPELSSKTTYKKDRQYISLVRSYFYNYNTPQGFVEVKQDLDTIFNVFESVIQPSNYEFIILNGNGIPIYPLEKQNLDFTKYYNAYLQVDSGNFVELKNPQTREKEIVMFEKIDNCDFISVIIINKVTLFKQVYQFIFKFILISIGIVIWVIWISFYLSKKITNPIIDIYYNVKNIDINQNEFMPNEYKGSNIREIDALWVALKVSHTRLQDSMKKLIISKQQDMQSKMLALQSQMNPHFLHNSLSALSSMIEEGEVEASLKLCDNMSSILRYISSGKEQLVTLEEDLENTQSYLDCMKFRYMDDLTYSFEVPDELLQIKIPKLSTQLLVENSIKYASLKSAPWHIHIRCYRKNNDWYIAVRDNGFGFDDQVLQDLKDKMNKINENNLLPNLELDGMGLMNIFIRLKLLYNRSAKFEIHNLDGGGCEVTIGGCIIYE